MGPSRGAPNPSYSPVPRLSACCLLAHQIIAAACLFLASKVEESPKPVKDVVRRCDEVRYAKNPAQLKKLGDAVGGWLADWLCSPEPEDEWVPGWLAVFFNGVGLG